MTMFNRLIIYASNVEVTARFYERFFGFKANREPGDRIVELVSPNGGGIIMLHPAARGRRRGQSIVKLVFDIGDLEAFCLQCARDGLTFGPIHIAEGL
ncbi:putative enzyme related to lactoylglutathione lyase [Rhizobium sp. BK060]|nr:putative enzyme related to lactoylglutathione lyase [Rhizobium sp. BK060]